MIIWFWELYNSFIFLLAKVRAKLVFSDQMKFLGATKGEIHAY